MKLLIIAAVFTALIGTATAQAETEYGCDYVSYRTADNVSYEPAYNVLYEPVYRSEYRRRYVYSNGSSSYRSAGTWDRTTKPAAQPNVSR
jgi:hypothetical protein